jgi:hypothetical protein
LRTIKSVLGKAERLRADIGNYRDRLLQSMILTIVPPLFQSDMPLFYAVVQFNLQQQETSGARKTRGKAIGLDSSQPS